MGGLLVAQSNRSLLAEQQWLEEEGYLAVPGTALRSEIDSWKTFLAGGLFFGLSVGLCYAFFWGLLLWGFRSWPKCRIAITIGILGLFLFQYFARACWTQFWAFGLFLIIIPCLLYLIFFIFKSYKNERIGITKAMPYIASFLGSIIIVYILMIPSFTGQDFIRIRDGVLGRTNWGRRISNFYYHYTLYPARVIKTFDQKLQRVLRIDTDKFEENEMRRLKSVLIWRDVFIGANAPSNTVIKKDAETDHTLIISDNPCFIIETELQEFINNPRTVLEEYSTRADSSGFLRTTVRWSLFQIWPLMAIFWIYCLFLFIFDLCFKKASPTRDALLAFCLVLCLMIGLSSLIKPFNDYSDTLDLLAALDSKSFSVKISAIMALSERIEKDRAGRFSEYFMRMIVDPDPIIRKWGIHFLAQTNEKKVKERLMPLLNDPDSDVAYHAARSLGKLKAREAREALVEILRGDREWYLKTTAYISLREIGWSQFSLMRNPTKRLSL